MIIIDGKSYPLWSKFVEDKTWVGGTLEELPDSFCDGASTEITDISLAKSSHSGSDLPFVTIHGKNFNVCFRVDTGGVTGGTNDDTGDWIDFHTLCCDFRIKKPT
jgi:hypothetical protein